MRYNTCHKQNDHMDCCQIFTPRHCKQQHKKTKERLKTQSDTSKPHRSEPSRSQERIRVEDKWNRPMDSMDCLKNASSLQLWRRGLLQIYSHNNPEWLEDLKILEEWITVNYGLLQNFLFEFFRNSDMVCRDRCDSPQSPGITPVEVDQQDSPAPGETRPWKILICF